MITDQLKSVKWYLSRSREPTLCNIEALLFPSLADIKHLIAHDYVIIAHKRNLIITNKARCILSSYITQLPYLLIYFF